MQDWEDLVAAVLETGPQLQCRTWENEFRVIKIWSRARGIGISQCRFLDEGDYADVQRQFIYSEHTFVLCCTAALNAWDRV